MRALRSLPLQVLVLGAVCALGCRQWATPAPPPPAQAAAGWTAPTPEPRGTRVSLRFEGGLLAHYQALPILEASGVAASFRVPETALGSPGHMARLQLGLLEEAGHQVLREGDAGACEGELPGGQVRLDAATPLARLAGAVMQAEARGGGEVQVVVCGLGQGEGLETLAHFLAWLTPRAQSGTHVRLAQR